MAVTFKPEFTYANIGNVVGKLTHVKPLQRKDGSTFGHDFLINVAGQGSVNVKVPMLQKSQEILDNFPIHEKPTLRFNLSAIDAYLSQAGKWYLSLTTFNGAEVPKEGMTDRAIGRVAGEVMKMKTDEQGNVVLMLAVFQTDKDGKQLINRKTGKPFEPKAIPITITDAELKAEIKKQKVVEGANIGIGYAFINKNDVGFDEFGFPTGSGKRVTRIEARKMVVYSVPKVVEPEPEPELVEDEFIDPFEEDGVAVDPFADDFELPF